MRSEMSPYALMTSQRFTIIANSRSSADIDCSAAEDVLSGDRSIDRSGRAGSVRAGGTFTDGSLGP